MSENKPAQVESRESDRIVFFPSSADKFEELCVALYQSVWQADRAQLYGTAGQGQDGIDILIEMPSGELRGVQCKNYTSTQFTTKTVDEHLKMLDDSELELEMLMFAVTLKSDTKVIKHIIKVSQERQKQGKCTVRIDYIPELRKYLRQPENKDIAAEYCPEHPDSMQSVMSAQVEAIYQHIENGFRRDNSESSITPGSRELLSSSQSTNFDSSVKADPLYQDGLDKCRDLINEEKAAAASDQLNLFKSSIEKTDRYTQFRYFTLRGAIALEYAENEQAADLFLQAYPLSPRDKRAITNKAHALLIKEYYEDAETTCMAGLEQYPEDSTLSAVLMATRLARGDEVLDEGIPKYVAESHEIAIVRARHLEAHGQSRQAFEVLEAAWLHSKERGLRTLVINRLMLSVALNIWQEYPVLAAHGGIRGEATSYAQRILSRLEPVENVTALSDVPTVQQELLNNVLIALHAIGDISKAENIALHYRSFRLDVPAISSILLDKWVREEDKNSLSDFASNALEEAPRAIAFKAIEAASSLGEIDVYLKIKDVVERYIEDDHTRLELDILWAQCQWNATATREAKVSAQTIIDEYPDSPMGYLLLAHYVKEDEATDQSVELTSQAGMCIKNKPDCHEFQRYYVAKAFFDHQLYPEALEHFETLDIPEGDNEITFCKLVCLITMGRREPALQLLDRLEPQTRNSRPFRVQEINLALARADWPLVEQLTQDSMVRFPENADLALNHMLALYHQGKSEILADFVNGYHHFPRTSSGTNLEIAKIECSFGHANRALRRVIRSIREHKGDDLACCHLIQLLFLNDSCRAITPPSEVGPGAQVRLTNRAGAERIYAIDTETDGDPWGWPDFYLSNSKEIQWLFGAKLGDSISPDGIVEGNSWKVEAIGSFEGAVVQEARQKILNSVRTDLPIKMLQATDTKTTHNLANDSADADRIYFDLYAQQKLTFSGLAMCLNRDPVTLLSQWSRDNPYRIRIDVETFQYDYAPVFSKKELTLDSMTLFEWYRRNLLTSLFRWAEKIWIPASVRSQLLIASQQSGLFGDTTLQAQINSLLDLIDTECVITPVTGPKESLVELEDIFYKMDQPTQDCIELALERGLVYLTEDANLRSMVEGTYIEVESPSLLIFLLYELGIVYQYQNSKVKLERLAANMQPIIFSVTDLVVVANASPKNPDALVIYALEILGNEEHVFRASLRVAQGFLYHAASTYPADILVLYMQTSALSLASITPKALRVILHKLWDAIVDGSKKRKDFFTEEEVVKITEAAVHLEKLAGRPSLRSAIRSILIGK